MEMNFIFYVLHAIISSSGYEWVGWQNKSDDPRRRLEMIFEFDNIRNFSRVDIHTNNDFAKNIQVFYSIKLRNKTK